MGSGRVWLTRTTARQRSGNSRARVGGVAWCNRSPSFLGRGQRGAGHCFFVERGDDGPVDGLGDGRLGVRHPKLEQFERFQQAIRAHLVGVPDPRPET
jgi:hypothetical protein